MARADEYAGLFGRDGRPDGYHVDGRPRLWLASVREDQGGAPAEGSGRSEAGVAPVYRGRESKASGGIMTRLRRFFLVDLCMGVKQFRWEIEAYADAFGLTDKKGS